MNTSRMLVLSRGVLAAGLVAASFAAHAGGGVYWSVNVSAPTYGLGNVSTSVSNVRRGVVVGQPVYVQPAPVVYAPPVVYASPEVYVQPRPVVYVAPRPVYVQPPVVVEAPRWGWRPGWAWHRHHGDHDRYAWDDDDDHRPHR